MIEWHVTAKRMVATAALHYWVLCISAHTSRPLLDKAGGLSSLQVAVNQRDLEISSITNCRNCSNPKEGSGRPFTKYSGV